MADDLVWEEPPRRHQQSEWFPKLAALKARPGQSARLFPPPNTDLSTVTPRDAANAANSIRNAAEHLGEADPAGNCWEITGRSIPGGGHGVWAKWVVIVTPEDLEDAPLAADQGGPDGDEPITATDGPGGWDGRLQPGVDYDPAKYDINNPEPF